jgi:hypothetical protein
MALIPGALQFGARVEYGTPLVLPRERSPHSTEVIKAGHPLVNVSGQEVRVASNSGGNIGAPGQTKILGFSLQDQTSAYVSDLPTGFATMPIIYFNANRAGYENIQVLPADGKTIFSMAVKSGQTVAQTLIGNTYAIAWDDTLKQCTINPGNTTVALARIVAIRPGDEGKTDGTGQVDFIVPDASSQYLSGN